MNNAYDLTSRQLRFLDLFKIAAIYDCLPLLEFYCMDLYDHDHVGTLSEDELERLAEAARQDIFSEALASGYKPVLAAYDGEIHGALC